LQFTVRGELGKTSLGRHRRPRRGAEVASSDAVLQSSENHCCTRYEIRAIWWCSPFSRLKRQSRRTIRTSGAARRTRIAGRFRERRLNEAQRRSCELKIFRLALIAVSNTAIARRKNRPVLLSARRRAVFPPRSRCWRLAIVPRANESMDQSWSRQLHSSGY